MHMHVQLSEKLKDNILEGVIYVYIEFIFIENHSTAGMSTRIFNSLQVLKKNTYNKYTKTMHCIFWFRMFTFEHAQ